jgi:5-formyltetrahydrofolate cyclo-ligase
MRHRTESVEHGDFSIMNSPTNKPELRKELIAARRALSADAKAQADARIATRLKQWLEMQQVKTLGGYLAIAGEPDLSALYAQLPALGIELAMPVVLEKDQPLVFVRWQAGDALAKDASGTMAPVTRGDYLRPDAVLAPCIGFTESGLRLGFGGGYFDRTLAQMPRPKAVGIAYAFAKVDFAAEPHDVPLDAIITD